MSKSSKTTWDIVRELRALAKLQLLSQYEVAKRMGTTQSAVSDMFGGRTEPRLSTLTRLAEALGCKLTITIESGDDDE